jgi:predicted metal-dependent phosphoesterase TrpH
VNPFATSVGIEQLAVADHFELDPVGLERLARELGGQHRVLRGLATCGIGQEVNVLWDEIDQAFVLTREADAPDGGRHHLGCARGNGVKHELAVGIPGGAEEET